MTETCGCCGGTAADPVGTAHDVDERAPFALVKCRGCGVVRVSPMPSEAELAPYYDEVFYGRPGLVGRALTRVFLDRRLAVLRAAGVTTGRLLDFGCGDGAFLDAARARGFTVCGVEPSEAGRAAAHARGLDVRASVADLDGAFDVVTSWQAVEHLHTPRDTLRAIHARTAHGGRLIVSVPNHGSPEARAFGDRWFHLDVPRHLHHFDRRSLTSLLASVGFDVERVTTHSLEYNVFGLVQSALNMGPGQRNGLYRVVKRGAHLSDLDLAARIKTATALATLPVLAAGAGVASAALELAGAGGTLTVTARRPA